VAAFGRSSGLEAGLWWWVIGISSILTMLPGLLNHLLSLAGPWAVEVGQSLVAPLSGLGIMLLYWEVREGDGRYRAYKALG